MYLDPLLLGAIAAVFGTATTGLGWLVSRLWRDRDDGVEKFIEMLRIQFADADARKTLWQNLVQSIVDQGRVIDGLRIAFNENEKVIERFERTIEDLRDEIRRLGK